MIDEWQYNSFVLEEWERVAQDYGELAYMTACTLNIEPNPRRKTFARRIIDRLRRRA